MKERTVHRFCEEYEPKKSYYIFELQYILGITKRSVYRLLKSVGIRAPDKRRKNRRVKLVELLKIVKTESFTNYIKRLKSICCKKEILSLAEYDGVSPSILNFVFARPDDGALNLNQGQIEDAIYCGLLPVVKINDEIFIDPNYINDLQGDILI